MDNCPHYLKYKHLYVGERALNRHEQLHDLLDAAEISGCYIFAVIICIRFYGHSNPRELKVHQIDRFYNWLDPIVSAALHNAARKQ